MAIAVQNITASTATVSWPSAHGCLDSFYSVMYHPNWNSLLMGYTRKNFLQEDQVPTSQTTASLTNLSPHTTYILCVTCQSARPSRDECRIFSTLGESGSDSDSDRKELAMGIWLASSILLLVIAGIMLYGCLHSWCDGDRDPAEVHPSSRTVDQDSPLPNEFGNPYSSAELVPGTPPKPSEL